MSRTDSAETSSSRFLVALVVFALALTAWVLWDMATDEPAERRASRSTPVTPPATTVAAAPEPSATQPGAPAVELAADGIPIKPAGSEQSTEHEAMHPHPIDDARRRIYHENNLNGAMMGAMNVGDFQGLRALIEEYRMDYPEDSLRLQEGYTIIADCLERLTPERQEHAREYWRTKRGSTVRRFIRRHCLDAPLAE